MRRYNVVRTFVLETNNNIEARHAWSCDYWKIGGLGYTTKGIKMKQCVTVWIISWGLFLATYFFNVSISSGCRQASVISDNYGKIQPIVGRAIPGLVVLHSLRKQAEQARRSKPVITIPSMVCAWPPVSRFLPTLSSCPLILFLM